MKILGKAFKSYCIVSITFFLITFGWSPPSISQTEADDRLNNCILELIQSAEDKTTIGEIRATCQKQMAAETQPEQAVQKRLAADKAILHKRFSIMAHKPNYILLGAYNFNGYNPAAYAEQYDNDSLDVKDIEAQFQISFKTPLAVALFNRPVDIYAAYTNRSFWQVYDKELSSPFRETNHEPEVWLQVRSGFDFAGISNALNILGVVHQSNGQGGVLSRSWNRIYADFIFEKRNLALSIKPWIRIQEKSENDDNPDITDYLGHGELRAIYHRGGHTLSMMVRNLIESNFENGAVELGWSFPFGNYKYIKGYIQYFSGYGESLIDYDQNVNRIGAGVLLYDWL